MNEHRQKVLVALVFSMAIRYVIVVVVILQQVALQQHYVAMAMIFARVVGEAGVSKRWRSIWMHDWRTNFFERQLFGCYMDQLFKAMYKVTFQLRLSICVLFSCRL